MRKHRFLINGAIIYKAENPKMRVNFGRYICGKTNVCDIYMKGKFYTHNVPFALLFGEVI